MDLTGIIEHAVDYAGSLNVQILIALFLACAIGEFGFSIPYLLETIWLLSGYNAGTGALPPPYLAVLWLAAQAGRQTGATAFYFLSRVGTIPLMKLYRRRFPPESIEKGTVSAPLPFRITRRVNILSPFSVGLARLFWMRVPVAVALSVKRKWSVLSRGILISSLIWDSTYMLLGAVGGKGSLTPLQMVLYSLTGLTILYITTFVAQRVLRFLASRRGETG